MDRQVRLLTVLAIGVAVVAATLWLWEPPDARRTTDADVPVWNIDRDDVTGIRVVTPQTEVSLQRDGDQWRLVSPIEAPADAREVEFLVVSLARLGWATPLDSADPSTPGAAPDLAQFGLAPPRATVHVTTADGRTHTLVAGDETPVGGSTYARIGERVVVLPHSIGDVVDVDVDALRDRAVLPFDPADVRQVRIDSAQGTLEVTGEGKRWWVAGLTRADVGRVEDLVYGLRRLRFLSFAEDLVPEGIADPAATVTVVTTDGSWSFAVGESGPMGTHVRRSDGLEGFVYPDSLAVIGAGPLDVADRSAFAFDPDEADTVEVVVGDTTLHLDRGDGGWARRDGGDPTPIVEALQAARITYLQAAVPDPGQERGRVTVTEGDLVVEVVIGQEMDGYAILADTAGGGPYRVEAAMVAPILAID